jgi:hypothetical protein
MSQADRAISRATIDAVKTSARYDGVADWYERLEEPASPERRYPHLLALRCRR